MKYGAKGTGHIRKRESGLWEGQYIHDGKRKSIYGSEYSDVRSRLNVICTELLNNNHVEVSLTTLEEWLVFWLENYSKPVTRQSTYISYETYIRAHIGPEIGGVKLRNLTPDIIQKFFNEKAVSGRKDMKAGGLSTKTLRNIKNMIHLALEQAIINDLLVKNVTKSVKLPKQQKKEIQVLSVKEQKKLEDTICGSDELLAWGAILALYTGMRIGEILALRWSDIDEDSGSLYVSHSLRRQNRMNTINPDDYTILPSREENKTALMIGQVKTLKANRTIYLPDKALEALEHFKSWQKEMILLSDGSFNTMGFVMCTEQGQPVDARYYQDVFARILKKAGVDRANFHTLRHTFSTRALEKESELNTLADILGHAQPSTTLNMYGHSCDDQKKTDDEVQCNIKTSRNNGLKIIVGMDCRYEPQKATFS